MKGVIVNFRRARHHQYDNQMVVKVEGVDAKEKATPLVGKAVSWKNAQGTEIKGVVRSSHGNKGCVRVLFERGMPGQSLGNAVDLQ